MLVSPWTQAMTSEVPMFAISNYKALIVINLAQEELARVADIEVRLEQ